LRRSSAAKSTQVPGVRGALIPFAARPVPVSAVSYPANVCVHQRPLTIAPAAVWCNAVLGGLCARLLTNALHFAKRRKKLSLFHAGRVGRLATVSTSAT
jgi:hypothetical protein